LETGCKTRRKAEQGTKFGFSGGTQVDGPELTVKGRNQEQTDENAAMQDRCDRVEG
jgi:hypothetical protein